MIGLRDMKIKKRKVSTNNQNWVDKSLFDKHVKDTDEMINKYQKLMEHYEKELKHKNEVIEIHRKLQAASDKLIDDYKKVVEDLEQMVRETIANAEKFSNNTLPSLPNLPIFDFFKK